MKVMVHQTMQEPMPSLSERLFSPAKPSCTPVQENKNKTTARIEAPRGFQEWPHNVFWYRLSEDL